MYQFVFSVAYQWRMEAKHLDLAAHHHHGCCDRGLDRRIRENQHRYGQFWGFHVGQVLFCILKEGDSSPGVCFMLCRVMTLAALCTHVSGKIHLSGWWRPLCGMASSSWQLSLLCSATVPCKSSPWISLPPLKCFGAFHPVSSLFYLLSVGARLAVYPSQCLWSLLTPWLLSLLLYASTTSLRLSKPSRTAFLELWKSGCASLPILFSAFSMWVFILSQSHDSGASCM